MYDAWHGIVPVSAVDAVLPALPAAVVGPVCKSGDTFSRSRRLPPLPANASVAILDAGAYDAVMSSTYNARRLAAEAWMEGDRWSVVRDRDRRGSGLRSEPRIGDGDEHDERAMTETIARAAVPDACRWTKPAQCNASGAADSRQNSCSADEWDYATANSTPHVS